MIANALRREPDPPAPLELHAASLLDGGRAARSRKPDSGHADTISITVRACRTRWSAMKPRIQYALTQ